MTAAAVLLAACGALLATGGEPAIAVRRLTRVAGRATASSLRRRSGALDGRGGVTVVFVVIGAACAAAVGPVAAGLAGIVAVTLRLAAARRSSRGVLACTEAAVPDACRTVAAGLSAGALPADALTAAAAGSPEPLAGVLRAAAFAEGLGVSAASVFARPPEGCEALLAVAVCWDVCVRAGVGLAATMDRLAGVFAAELEAAAVVDAELAGVRLSALVMACLPLFGLALGAALGSDPLHFLVATPAGRVAFAVAAVLDGCGVLWIGRLAASAAR